VSPCSSNLESLCCLTPRQLQSALIASPQVAIHYCLGPKLLPPGCPAPYVRLAL
jgi:hypothetical protein